MALVAILTLLIPETKGATLEDIENERLFIGKPLGSQASSLANSPEIQAMETEKNKNEVLVSKGSEQV